MDKKLAGWMLILHFGPHVIWFWHWLDGGSKYFGSLAISGCLVKTYFYLISINVGTMQPYEHWRKTKKNLLERKNKGEKFWESDDIALFGVVGANLAYPTLIVPFQN